MTFYFFNIVGYIPICQKPPSGALGDLGGSTHFTEC